MSDRDKIKAVFRQMRDSHHLLKMDIPHDEMNSYFLNFVMMGESENEMEVYGFSDISAAIAFDGDGNIPKYYINIRL